MSKLFKPFFSIIFLSILGVQVSAQSNQYLHFDGVDDFAVLENASQYLVGADGMSLTGWFYTDALVYGQGFFGFRGTATGDGEMYVIELNNGTLECRYISTAGFHEAVGPAGTGQAGVWQHVAWIYTGTAIELYIDGQLIVSNSASGTFETLDRSFGIGKSIQPGFNFVFGGRIDEVSVWSKGLTQSEIQDMMANELVGDEANLELYYKMNQGSPGGNNVSITELISEVGGGTRNATLMNFALTGETSNFNGTLESGFQSINFPQIPNMLISADPYELDATVNSGLAVSYTVISGPATINGSTLTIDGTPGEVVVRASQAGDAIFDPAADVDVTFQVLDPALVNPIIDLRNPVSGDFYASSLRPILLASIVDIDYPELFNVTNISYEVDGEPVDITDYGNKHQTGWWTPTSFGVHTFSVTATHNEGNSHTESVTFEIINSTTSQQAVAFNEVWVDADNFSVEAEGELPSYVGSFDQIQGSLDIGCPPGGCDPWDRVSSVEVRGHNGEWYEIIRYLTPYGVACQHEIDLTDFMSLLQGKVRFRVNLGTQGNGFLYTLNLAYNGGVPDNAYSTVKKLWYKTYSFGDPANLQPTETIEISYPENAQASTIKVVSSGHGWGENNTANAAEFHHDIHHIWVNGSQTFTQDNWNVCDPNPDGCSPQFGTWYYNRAGWCPGSIAQFFDYNMQPFVGANTVTLNYVFNESYVDNCHPNNPNCVSGVTCTNCNDGFNPHLIVSSYLITLGDAPLDQTDVVLDIENLEQEISFGLFPNPSAGRFTINLEKEFKDGTVSIFDELGRLVQSQEIKSSAKSLDIDLGNDVVNGIYFVHIKSPEGSGYSKLVVE